jgi:hypothetical protein
MTGGPSFNIADAAVSIGVLILIFFYKKHQKETEESEENSDVKLPQNNSSENIVSDNIENVVEEKIPENPGRENSDGEPDKGKKIPD